MIDEDKLNAFADTFAKRFAQAESRILKDIGETLKKTGDLTPSQAKKLQQMYTYGADVKKFTDEIAKASGKSLEEIEKLYEKTAQEERDWSKPFYDAKGVMQVPLKENKALMSMIESMAAVTKNELANLSRTTAIGVGSGKDFRTLGDFYKSTVDQAITAVATGVSDYKSVIRGAVKELGSGGLRVRYESGYTRRLDSAARQNILDGVRYIAQETAKRNGEEFGADGYEISAHSPCAPDHIEVQGLQLSKKEFEKLQSRLKRPIGEWNCRHIAYPIVLGVSRPANSKAELAEMERQSNEKIEIDGEQYTRYECSQIQRQLETRLRYAGEEKVFYKTVGDDDLTRQATEKIRILTNKYVEVSNKAGLPTRVERMRNIKTKFKAKISSLIESRNSAKGNPNAILMFDIDLNKRQKRLLNALSEYDSKVIVRKSEVSMKDLSALTAKTGDEFALFTKGKERLIIRGNRYSVNISEKEAKKLYKKGYKWSGHTHPGYDYNCLIASDGDTCIAKAFKQERMVIYNSKGQYSIEEVEL